MSLRGRYIIDRIHQAIGHRFRVPCPPYHEPSYWDKGVYKSLGPSDVYEWGDIHWNDDLEEHSYDLLLKENCGNLRFMNNLAHCWTTKLPSDDSNTKTSFREALGLQSKTTNTDTGNREENIMLLGCGNSKLGEYMAQSHQFKGNTNIIQVDISQKLVSNMESRCSSYLESGVMSIVEDDATCLSAFSNNSVSAVVDKGLIDAFYCSKHPQSLVQISSVLQSVNRVLIPGGFFTLFSFSRPEFLLDAANGESGNLSLWKNLQVRKLPDILMYRFEKRMLKKSNRRNIQNHSRR